MSDVRTLVSTWQGGMRFTSTRTTGGPALLLDGDGAAAQSPVDALLSACAACSGIDVVAILEKMKQPLSALEVRVSGTRAEDHPKRIVRVDLVYAAAGEGLDETKVRRAAELSVEKYCSVMQSLAKDCEVHWTVELRGA